MRSPAGQLAQLGLSPKKALGQHFLHDRAIVRRICDVADLPAGSLVVEVGPGLGVLTRALAERVENVVALEKDAELAAALDRTMPDNVEIRALDALEFDPASLGDAGYHFVSNLPYNVAPAILRRFLDSSHPPETCTFMVQREVAERIVARPPEMNILAIAMQFHGTPKIAFRVGRGAFTPPPRVTSSVVRMPVQRAFDLPQQEIEGFFRLVRAGFSARRKQLKNSLQNSGFDAALVAAILDLTEIDPKSRPQELDVADWIAMFDAWRQLDPGDAS